MAAKTYGCQYNGNCRYESGNKVCSYSCTETGGGSSTVVWGGSYSTTDGQYPHGTVLGNTYQNGHQVYYPIRYDNCNVDTDSWLDRNLYYPRLVGALGSSDPNCQ